MMLYTIGKIAIGLQIILLLVWAYSLLIMPNGTDAAGKGTAMVLLLGFGGYIAIGVLLLLTKKFWPQIIMLVMAAIPLVIIITMLVKEFAANADNT